jgi:hypothetical protein
MTDPRDFDRMEMERRMATPTPWGWIAGAVFVVIVLALIFTSGGNSERTAQNANPPTTTGMAPRAAPAPIPATPPPAQQPAR